VGVDSNQVPPVYVITSGLPPPTLDCVALP
jgi:hypothetical protein